MLMINRVEVTRPYTVIYCHAACYL